MCEILQSFHNYYLKWDISKWFLECFQPGRPVSLLHPKTELWYIFIYLFIRFIDSLIPPWFGWLTENRYFFIKLIFHPSSRNSRYWPCCLCSNLLPQQKSCEISWADYVYPKVSKWASVIEDGFEHESSKSQSNILTIILCKMQHIYFKQSLTYNHSLSDHSKL